MVPVDAHLPRPVLHPSSLFLLCLSFSFSLMLLSPPPSAVAQGMAEDQPGLKDGSQPRPEVPAGLVDGMSLLMFKDTLGDPAALSSWVQGVSPCDEKRVPWAGVVCTGGVVTGLHLGTMGLSGTLNKTAADALAQIQGLRTISFASNNFSGDLPPLGDLIALKSIFLSNNQFSGSIDDDYFSDMVHLKKVWLSGNAFTGKIPSSLAKLSHLMELHLENNQFSG